MELSNMIVEVRSSSLERVGIILPDDLELDAEILHNDVGWWTCAISRTHPLTEALLSPGAGILVTDIATGEALFSGPAHEPVESQSVTDLGGTVTVRGATDEQVLVDMLAWPDPASGNVDAQSLDFDERTGPAETLMHEYVSSNVGPEAPSQRRNMRVAMGEDLGRGSVVTKAARFNSLLDLMQDLADADGITFRVIQVDGKLEFQTSVNPDRGRLVRLDAELEGVVSNRFSQTAPSLTRAIVGGRGGNASRKFLEVVSDDSLAAEEDWGRRVERFLDRQDARSEAELDLVGREALAVDGRTALNARIEPSDQLRAGLGGAWSLGDTVSVRAGGDEHVAPVTGVILKVSKQRLRVGVLLGLVDTVRTRRGRRKSAITDAADEKPLWENGDSYTLTAANVTAGSFAYQLTHDRPLPESVQGSWVNLVQPSPAFSVSDSGLVAWALSGHEQEGDLFQFHYMYLPSIPDASVPEVTAWEEAVEALGDVLAWYDHAESEGTTMFDRSGFDRHGTYGAGVVLGGEHVELSGASTDTGDVPYGGWMNPSTGFTMITVYRTTHTATGHHPFSRKGGTDRNYGLGLGATGAPSFAIQGPSSVQSALSSVGGSNDGDWHVAVGTYDNATIRIHLDGPETGTYPNHDTISGPVTDPYDLQVGGRGIEGSYFNGDIAESVLIGRVLTPAEIADLQAAWEATSVLLP